ncbi:ATP-binding protein [Nocardia mikamii]|uniref:ATP-binding protein n=1 Tax=Nocardia mikamii TaxID=508464 RepID=UPI000B0BE2AF|nr:ATP-binding protein [Nocardia mikamii]
MSLSEWISPSTDPAPTGSVVGVRVLAQARQLLMLRALAETVALMAEFALDEVTDIRVALDEIATALIERAVAGSSIECDFGYDGDRMSVAVTAVAVTPEALHRDGLGWHVLTSITDSLEATTAPFDSAAAGYPVTVEFRRLRRHGITA